MNFYKPKEKKEMGQIDYGIFYTLCILLSIGVVMVYSTSSFYAMFHNNDSMYFFKKTINLGNNRCNIYECNDVNRLS